MRSGRGAVNFQAAAIAAAIFFDIGSGSIANVEPAKPNDEKTPH
jgi:hypothetical protein